MAGPKTSAEKAREDAENAAADDMFGGAFGGIDGMEVPTPAPEESPASDEQTSEVLEEQEAQESMVDDTSSVEGQEEIAD